VAEAAVAGAAQLNYAAVGSPDYCRDSASVAGGTPRGAREGEGDAAMSGEPSPELGNGEEVARRW
jgi:hypothetical protein